MRNALYISMLLLALTGNASAAPPVLDLHIQMDGKVRIGDGPVMGMQQFQARLERFKQQRPQPDLLARVENGAPLEMVTLVIQVMRDADYDEHLKLPETGGGN